MAVALRSLFVPSLIVGAMTLSACSRNETVTSATSATSTASTEPVSTTEPTTPPTTASAPTTEPAAPATTTPPATTPPTAAPVSTTAPTTAPPATTLAPALTAGDIVLRAGGLGPFDLTTPDSDAIAGLTEALGAPTSDDAQTYPVAEGGQYLDVTEEESFVSPIGRTVCFANGLCAQFGGPTTSSLVLTGWNLWSELAPVVATAEGVTVGSPVSAFASAITVYEGGCYSSGSGDVGGVTVNISSEGLPFGEFTDAGDYVSRIPDLADLTVVGLSAGDLPFFLFADC